MIGIDGGGTKTEIAVADMQGRPIARKLLGPLNPVAYPNSPAQIAKELEEYAGGDCKGICIAAAGTAAKQDGAAVKAAFQSICTGTVIVRTDIENLLYAAVGADDGLIVCAGTGSVCLGQKGGITARAGGRGHVFDDGGSAYAIGRDVLAAVIRASDGRGAQTALSKLLFDVCKTEDIAEITARYTAPQCKKSEIAALAPLLLNEGAKGDPVAEKIEDNAAAELALLALAVIKKLGLAACPVAFCGGMISRNKAIFKKSVAIIKAACPKATCFLYDGGNTGPALCAARYVLSQLGTLDK